MKLSAVFFALTFGLVSAAPTRSQPRAPATTPSGGKIQGFDISGYQPNVNFQSAYSSGARFVIIKASCSTIEAW